MSSIMIDDRDLLVKAFALWRESLYIDSDNYVSEKVIEDMDHMEYGEMSVDTLIEFYNQAKEV